MRGFSGVPINLLVAFDPKGAFLDVQVLSHHEPVFLEGLGEAPMLRFVAQYKGLSLTQSVAIGTAPRGGPRDEGSLVHTVAAPSGMLADGLSTAFMVMGAQRSLALAAGIPGVDLLGMGKQGRRWQSPGLRLQAA